MDPETNHPLWYHSLILHRCDVQIHLILISMDQSSFMQSSQGLPWTVSLMCCLFFFKCLFPTWKMLKGKTRNIEFFKDPKPVRKLWIKLLVGKKSHWLILLTIAVLSTPSSPKNLKLSMPSPLPLNDWLLDFDWQALEGPTGTTPCDCLYSGCLNACWACQ